MSLYHLQRSSIWFVISSDLDSEPIFCFQDCSSQIAHLEYQGQTRCTRILDSKPFIKVCYRIGVGHRIRDIESGPYFYSETNAWLKIEQSVDSIENFVFHDIKKNWLLLRIYKVLKRFWLLNYVSIARMLLLQTQKRSVFVLARAIRTICAGAWPQ